MTVVAQSLSAMCALALSRKMDSVADDDTTEENSVLFDEQQDPLVSNRDELIDIEAALTMKLTAPPSVAPSPQSLVSTTNLRGPPPQSDTIDFHSNGAGNPFGGTYHGDNDNPTFYSSDADLKEFIAFVGEYSVPKFFSGQALIHFIPY